jgi:hypothetical protein
MEDRYEEMRQQVIEFTEANPDVWRLFCGFTFDLINRGFSNYSANAIFERIRWEKDVGGNGVIEFKLNNNYRAFYARAFMRKYPEHEGFFRTRDQVSKEKPATYLPELTPADYETLSHATI